jgi:RNA polymerase sigma-70 factor (ECF subfamily)
MIEAMRLEKTSTGPAATSPESVRTIFERACRGDEEAFRLIFNRYARPVMSFLYDLVNNHELAEELTQETFVRAHRMLNTMREDTKVSTWLFGIAKNVSREAVRHRIRSESNVEIAESGLNQMSDPRQRPDGELLTKELNCVIHHALSLLDEDKRLIFSLQAFHQHSYEEIAEITGFTIPKIKTDLHRAKAEMRKRIRPYLGERHEL